ncbi:MAG: hypothetical protein JSV08_07660 [Acidobacteriota bacterium]|nr:MAG: hypothetical protein JSV08_07660 [Acidobacteriota bacterium]
MSDRRWLEEKILDFAAVVWDCLGATTYADDWPVYLKDLAVITGWLVALHRGMPARDAAGIIVDPQTDKTLSDYYRQGEWGERHNRAFAALQTQVREHFGL